MCNNNLNSDSFKFPPCITILTSADLRVKERNITSTDFIEILHASELQAAAAGPELEIFTVYYWRDGTKTALQSRTLGLGHTSLSCLATLRGGEVGVKHKQSDSIIHV